MLEFLEDKDFKIWEYILFNNSYQFAFNYSGNRFYYNFKLEGMKERFIGIETKIILYKNEFMKRHKN